MPTNNTQPGYITYFQPQNSYYYSTAQGPIGVGAGPQGGQNWEDYLSYAFGGTPPAPGQEFATAISNMPDFQYKSAQPSTFISPNLTAAVAQPTGQTTQSVASGQGVSYPTAQGTTTQGTNYYGQGQSAPQATGNWAHSPYDGLWYQVPSGASINQAGEILDAKGVVLGTTAQPAPASTGGTGGTTDTTGATGGTGGFNIPTNLFPTSGSVSGLSPDVAQWVFDQLKTNYPQMFSGYQNTLNQLSSPESFIKAYEPIQQGLFKNLLDQYGQKGTLSSSVMSDALAQAMQWGPQAYYQNLANTANLYGQGVGTTQGLLNPLSGSVSSSTNPLAPYELMANMILGLY